MPHTVVVQGSSPQTIVLGEEVVEFVQPGTQGPPGPSGPAGPTGNAEEWHAGAGAPAGGLGVIGDFYLDTSSGDVYEKTGASTWTNVGNIKGPQGPAGGGVANAYSVISGTSGTANSVSSDTISIVGADSSITTTASDSGPDQLTIQVDVVDAGFY